MAKSMKTIRQDVLILLTFWDDLTASDIAEIIDLNDTQVLAALFLLEGKGLVTYDQFGIWRRSTGEHYEYSRGDCE